MKWSKFSESKKKMENKNENRAEVQYLQPNVEQKNLVMKEEAMNHTVHGYKKLTLPIVSVEQNT